MNVITSEGGVADSLLFSRLAVCPALSSPRMTQPKLLEGFAIQFCTSVIICEFVALDQVTSPGAVRLSTAAPLTVELNDP
ncbi:MAG TPA: hypothetical protein VGG64_29510, partial [Pirellulales bacterium]